MEVTFGVGPIIEQFKVTCRKGDKKFRNSKLHAVCVRPAQQSSGIGTRPVTKLLQAIANLKNHRKNAKQKLIKTPNDENLKTK